MNRKEILLKRIKISEEINNLKKATQTAKDFQAGDAINKKIKLLKKQHEFYNELLKAIGGKDDN